MKNKAMRRIEIDDKGAKRAIFQKYDFHIE